MTAETFSRRNMRNQGIALLFLLGLTILFFFSIATTWIDVTFGPFHFDAESVLEEPSNVICPEFNTSQPLVFPKQTDIYDIRYNPTILPGSDFVLSEKYAQSHFTIFQLMPDSVDVWDKEVLASGTDDEYAPRDKHVLCTVDGLFFFARVPIDMDISSPTELHGVFLPLLNSELIELHDNGIPDTNIDKLFLYKLDTMISPITAIDSISFFWMFAVLIGWVVIVFFFVRRIKYPPRRYLHKQMSNMNVDPHTLEEQLKTANREKKVYYTKDWIITQKWFRTSIQNQPRNER